jgi:hypothetical protein
VFINGKQARALLGFGEDPETGHNSRLTLEAWARDVVAELPPRAIEDT